MIHLNVAGQVSVQGTGLQSFVYIDKIRIAGIGDIPVHPGARVGEGLVVVAGIHDPSQGELFGLAHALRVLCFELGLAQCGQQQGRQNGDDGDDDQKLDQGKSAATLAARPQRSNCGRLCVNHGTRLEQMKTDCL